MSITDSATPKKEEERIANIIVKSFNQKKKKKCICVNYYLRNLLFKTSLNNT